MNDVDHFVELINKVDIDSMSFVDQMAMAMAFNQFKETAEPILLKYAANDPKVTNFLYKL